MDNRLLQSRILDAREHSLSWLDKLQQPGAPRGVLRISAAHDALAWPGVLLPGTYNAVMARSLLGGHEGWQPEDRDALAQWLLAHRDAHGVFHIPGLRDADTFKKPDPVETRRYIDFHVTNYSLGAIDCLLPGEPARLDFARPWLEPQVLKAWLAERDLRDPWQEGNNIVNLAGFLMLMARDAPATHHAVDTALTILFEWHDRLQEPATGFWGVGQLADPQRALHAMAGSMHNYHLWYALGRPLPYHEKAVDWALAQPVAIDSACIDVDLVDLLVHGHDLIDHRRPEIRAWLRAMLPLLLDFQNDDGGFADTRSGTRRQDGWVRGYEEPQGLSNTFATWFRWIAIAMVADCLWPGWQAWTFRRMVGIGYRKNALA